MAALKAAEKRANETDDKIRRLQGQNQEMRESVQQYPVKEVLDQLLDKYNYKDRDWYRLMAD